MSIKSPVIYPRLLKSAVLKGDLSQLRKLFKTKHLPMTTPDPENGWPMLFYAIQQHQNHIVEYFLKDISDPGLVYKVIYGLNLFESCRILIIIPRS